MWSWIVVITWDENKFPEAYIVTFTITNTVLPIRASLSSTMSNTKTSLNQAWFTYRPKSAEKWQSQSKIKNKKKFP